MKNIVRSVAALAVLVSAALPGHAQAQGPRNPQFQLKLGILRPTSSAGEALGNTWYAAGVEYLLGNSEARTVNSLEALYTAKKNSESTGIQQSVETKARVLSLMFNHKIRANRAGLEAGNIFFYGGGVGATITRIKVSDSASSTGSSDRSSTKAAANVFIGTEVGNNAQLELKYEFQAGKTAGRRIDGVFVLLGFKL